MRFQRLALLVCLLAWAGTGSVSAAETTSEAHDKAIRALREQGRTIDPDDRLRKRFHQDALEPRLLELQYTTPRTAPSEASRQADDRMRAPLATQNPELQLAQNAQDSRNVKDDQRKALEALRAAQGQQTGSAQQAPSTSTPSPGGQRAPATSAAPVITTPQRTAAPTATRSAGQTTDAPDKTTRDEQDRALRALRSQPVDNRAIETRASQLSGSGSTSTARPAASTPSAAPAAATPSRAPAAVSPSAAPSVATPSRAPATATPSAAPASTATRPAATATTTTTPAPATQARTTAPVTAPSGQTTPPSDKAIRDQQDIALRALRSQPAENRGIETRAGQLSSSGAATSPGQSTTSQNNTRSTAPSATASSSTSASRDTATSTASQSYPAAQPSFEDRKNQRKALEALRQQNAAPTEPRATGLAPRTSPPSLAPQVRTTPSGRAATAPATTTQAPIIYRDPNAPRTRQEKLADILEEYKADKLTPEQYQQRRREILAQPE